VAIPDRVRRSITALLDGVDAAAPGLVQAAYLTGSVALEDFQPEISDIDAVFVTARPLNDRDLVALSTVHRPASPHTDVLYVTSDELRDDPANARGPHSLEGSFHSAGAFAANPVEWRTLQTRALTIRGPALSPADVWFDPEVLRAWNVGNLQSYWRALLDPGRTYQPTEAIMRSEYGLQWIVLGIPRLHYTITTLGVTSKTGAAAYALEISDKRWHPVIESAIALRRDRDAPLPLDPEELRASAVDLATWLINDAVRRAG
jgi:hypothetical protein